MNADVAARAMQIETDQVALEGNLSLPAGARGLVFFVHGSGSSQHSPRNRYVAEQIQGGGLGTLLFDLLTAQIKIAPGATHLFEEPGALERVSEMARDWFRRFLAGDDEIHFQ